MWEPPEFTDQTLAESAIEMHELFKSLRESGFTKHECWHFMLGKVDCERKDCR